MASVRFPDAVDAEKGTHLSVAAESPAMGTLRPFSCQCPHRRRYAQNDQCDAPLLVKVEIGCHSSRMAAARIVAVLPVVLVATLTAQTALIGRVLVTVVDPTAAVIPGAHIGIIRLPSDAPNDGDLLHYAHHASEQASADTDGSGEANLGLAKGSYAVAVSAKGFNEYVTRIEIRDETSQIVRATLRVGDSCPPLPCLVEASENPVPLERDSFLNEFIPLEPLQTMTLPAVRVRRWLRF
jgi:hypothetical protein